MFHIVWKDYDGANSESFDNRVTFAKRLMKLLREEENEEYGLEIILVVDGSEVNYEYELDKVNYIEKLRLYGDVIIVNEIEEPKTEKKISCPTCKSLAERASCVSFLNDGEYYTLDRYKCPSCVGHFYL